MSAASAMPADASTTAIFSGAVEKPVSPFTASRTILDRV